VAFFSPPVNNCGAVLAKLLVIDNYDSFTYNLVQMFMLYDLEISVHRSDKISVTQVLASAPDYILISPGPKDPGHAGISVNLVKSAYHKIPILGVCLGMQCINEAFGGRTVHAPIPVHGKTSFIIHEGKGVFKNIPSKFEAARYHSLVAEIVSNDLTITSRSDDGVVMGLSHPERPVHGVQFHPESFLTQYGFELVENFLKLGSIKHAFT